MKPVQTLRVAAVQMECANAKIEENLARATHHLEEAVARGAKLVLLPEFLATGYVFTKAIWDGAEPKHGPTARWLADQSKRHGVHLGASFLEADGEDFFNTFVLTTPAGGEAGRVRKQTPAIFEAYFTRGDDGPHVIDTELGRVGVGICYENQLAYAPRLFHTHAADLVLMPHSAPSPQRRRPLSSKTVDLYEEMLRTLPTHYSRVLGVPVVLVNKSGPWRSSLPGLPFFAQDSIFPGLSAIADGDGRLKAQLGAEPGVLVEDVVLDPSRKKGDEPACHGRWSRPLPWSANLFRLAEIAGSAWYERSDERRRRAREVSSRSS